MIVSERPQGARPIAAPAHTHRAIGENQADVILDSVMGQTEYGCWQRHSDWRRWAIALFLLLASTQRAAAEDVIYAVPNGDWRLLLQQFDPQSVRGPDGKPVPGQVVALREALSMAWPGVTIQLLPGVYKQDTAEDGILFPRNGSQDKPITLRGMGSDTIIDGTIAGAFDNKETSVVAGMAKSLLDSMGLQVVRKADEMSLLLRPDYRGGSICFRFDEKQWIALDNLTLRDCADAGVIVRNSQYITLRNSIILKGLYAFFAEGVRTHHLLVENNIWIQDTSEDMWSRRHWCEYKYGKLRGQAGALFAGLDIAGGVIIRRNKVAYAFNAVRVDVSTPKRNDRAWRGKLSANIEVYDNDFSFIRDNVLEPEYDATNWWFHNNRIRNAHAWFSFDGLYGGRWYLYDNAGWFDDKPSRECATTGSCKEWQERNPELCGDLHDGGRVFKFRPDGRYAPGPLYIFNNSWYLRSSVIKDGRLGYIGHWNNAIGFCRPEDYPDGLCEGTKPFFNGFMWDIDNYSFGFDLSNHPDFPTGLRREGYRVNGIAVSPLRPLFVDAAHGNLELADGVPGRRDGCIIAEDDDGVVTCEAPRAQSEGPDVGVPMSDEEAPRVSYVHYENGLYTESPRMVKVELPGTVSSAFRVTFSTAIALMGSDVRAELSYGSDSSTVLSEPCRAAGRVLTCDVGAELPPAPPLSVSIPDAIVGSNGELATVWGSVSDIVTLKR